MHQKRNTSSRYTSPMMGRRPLFELVESNCSNSNCSNSVLNIFHQKRNTTSRYSSPMMVKYLWFELFDTQCRYYSCSRATNRIQSIRFLSRLFGCSSASCFLSRLFGSRLLSQKLLLISSFRPTTGRKRRLSLVASMRLDSRPILEYGSSPRCSYSQPAAFQRIRKTKLKNASSAFILDFGVFQRT